ncbi:hypothetical protein [Novosphingobium jiangmenense]|uniref:Uncharacterized protein n=1 Tax=Novosphingobium jiangmenense TaxID=2791981 RepID=A0ABS0HG66_9SPHN|nr:hypothetical protein [Novosphingobium jiangmenense]MBF9151255.1 hypothetical protein [Novosphingobium jiangmenense]
MTTETATALRIRDAIRSTVGAPHIAPRFNVEADGSPEAATALRIRTSLDRLLGLAD